MSGEARELKRLCTFLRDNGETEVRWSWDEYSDPPKSSKYVHSRKWVRGRDGEWHPTKAGITIRLSELDEVVSQLRRVQRARDRSSTNGGYANGVRRPTHTTRPADDRQQSITTTGRTVSCDELDAGEVF